MDATEIEARLDPRGVLAALGYAETSEPRRVKGGWDTLLWRFQTPDGREHSLRVYHLPRIQPLAWRERVALETCERAGLPAPRVEVAGEHEGLPVMVLSWCPGRPLLSFVEQKPWALWRLGRLFGRAQARMHAVEPPAEFAASAPGDWVSRVADEYRDLAEHALSLQPSTRSLIHLDFHPLNLVSDGRSVTGILDWSGAAAGDRRADLARTAITLIAAPIPPRPMKPLLSLARRLIIWAWRSGYQDAAGALPDYRPFMAWAGATLLTEIEPIIDRPNVWGTRQDIENFRRLVEVCARQAGIR
ncbi:MAG TPA: aminoglycoside phosphotransferase family protein [Dehalococcoidia bacterium]|nr:aminoglycoside phosphotransferase family protein [Dehalococcoidia bacterium]